MKTGMNFRPTPTLLTAVARKETRTFLHTEYNQGYPMKPPFRHDACFWHLFIAVFLLFYSVFHVPHSAFAAKPTPTPLPEAEWDAGLGLTTYGAEVKSGCWYPVWVEIRATKAPVRGRVTISQPGNPLRIEIPIDAAKGSRKIYRASYRPFFVPVTGYSVVSYAPSGGNSAELEFKLEAEPIGTATIPVNLRFAQPGDRHVLILGEQVGGFNFLNRLGGASDTQGRATILGRRAVLYGKPELIPDDPVTLQSLDAMVIDTPEVRRLEPAQWAAIRGWVARGGRLLLAAGRQQPFIQQSALKDPFGVRIRAPEPVTSITLDRSPVLAAWPEPSSTPWDLIWFGTAARPFLAGRRVGQGWFNLCAAALDKPVTDVLMKSSTSQFYQPLEALLSQESLAPSPLLVYAVTAERDLGLSLQRGFAVTLADIGWVILYLLAYNLIAMPLNWWVCRRLGRPAWSWPLLVLLAVAFAWYGYRSGTARQQKNFQVNELAFISRPSPEAPAQALAYTTLFTPRRITGDLPAAGRAYLNRLALSDREVAEPLTLGFDPVTAVRGVTLFPWTVLNLRDEFSPPASDGLIEVDHPIPVKDRKFTADLGPLTLTNKTGYTFHRWWLRFGDITWSGTAPLEPGKPVTIHQFTPDPAEASLGSLAWPFIDTAFSPNRAAGGQAPANLNNPDSLNRTSPPDDGKLYFLGQAYGAASPFAQAFAGQRTLGCIFYEQPLPMRIINTPQPQAIADNAWHPGPWTWKVTVVGGTPTTPGDQYLLSHQGTLGLCFPLNTVVFEVAPKKVRQPGERNPSAAALSFRFASHPNTTASWTNAATGRQYQMDSCLVEVYNFRNRFWEPRGVMSTPRLSLSPLADYLHPGASAIVLRLRAEPDSLRYRPATPPVISPGSVPPPPASVANITGKELFEGRFGVQLPVTLQDMLEHLRRGDGDPSPWNPPYSAQILDFSVALFSNSPRTSARP